MEPSIYVVASGFALFCLTQTIITWLKVARMEATIEAKFKDLYHHLTELEELHPRRGNPGDLEHDGGEHPHDVGSDGLAS